MRAALTAAGFEVEPTAGPNEVERLYKTMLAGQLPGNSNSGQNGEASKRSDAKEIGAIEKDHKEATSAEMVISELQKEVKELRERIASLEVAVVEKNYLDQIALLVKPFSGDTFVTFQKWLPDLENAFRLLALNDKQKVIAIARLLTGSAEVFLRTIRVSDYTELKANLLKEFSAEFSQEEAIKFLRKRRLQANETVHRYVLDIEEMAMSCSVPEEEVVDIIIEGLGDATVYNSMLYGLRTVNELKQMIHRYERMRFGSSRRTLKT
ncbi:Dwil\GK21266-PA-like protein [Anopheles sinensis]|uniref:Dwil\GK21266-PA-like protein n=1 Tax=Anopheles sinensis TaxID=74873 RepID=A0A084VMA0_ANOSI|nr:Dwil\GK21266-PA-like protein [Anopheles sinensis]